MDLYSLLLLQGRYILGMGLLNPASRLASERPASWEVNWGHLCHVVCMFNFSEEC